MAVLKARHDHATVAARSQRRDVGVGRAAFGDLDDAALLNQHDPVGYGRRVGRGKQRDAT